MDKNIVVIRGGGDLASGVAACLYEAGFGVVVTELAQPLVVRRAVSFAEAVYEGTCTVEGITGRLVNDAGQAGTLVSAREIAVLVDPECACVASLNPIAIVDARMLKRDIPNTFDDSHPLIGLGPGFNGGVNCWVAIETNRELSLGKFLRQAAPNLILACRQTEWGLAARGCFTRPGRACLRPSLTLATRLMPDRKWRKSKGSWLSARFAGLFAAYCETG